MDSRVRDVVIIGAGQAGAEAALALRQLRYRGGVTVIGAEDLLPYSRPLLSKDFLIGALPAEKLPLRTAQAYERADITMRLGETVVALSPELKTVTLASGEVLHYAACILAAGASARRILLPGDDLEGIYTLRSRVDADRLRAALGSGVRLVVLGAGYLGLEVAASARKLGSAVTVIEATPRVLGRSASELTARALARRHQREGVDLRLGAAAVGFIGHNGKVRAVGLRGGEEIAADVVVIAVGANPETGLAKAAGIRCDHGILADADARTSAADVYAIGDCALWDTGDGRGALRLESVQMASQGARAAAAAIAGAPRPAVKQPYFWSNQYDLKLQIAGVIPAGQVTEDVLDGDLEGAFAVKRSANGRLLAVEAVNAPRKYIEAQLLIGQSLPQFARGEVGEYSFRATRRDQANR